MMMMMCIQWEYYSVLFAHAKGNLSASCESFVLLFSKHYVRPVSVLLPTFQSRTLFCIRTREDQRWS